MLEFFRIQWDESALIGEMVPSMRRPNARYRKAMELIDKRSSPTSVLYWYISEFEFWNTRNTHVYTLNRRTVCNGVATGFLSACRMIYCRHEQAPRNLRTLFPASLRPPAFDVISRNVQTVAWSCNVDATKGTIRLPFVASYIHSGSWFAVIIPQSW